MLNIRENISLKNYNSFGLDVSTRYFTQLTDVSQIMEFLNSEYATIQPRLILGEGSNILFAKDFEGMVIRPLIKGIEKIEENEQHVFLRVGSGENWDEFVRYCIDKDYGGIENLSLIPGSVGASPVQNIGAYGVEVKDVIDYVEAIDLSTFNNMKFLSQECEFDYRNSVFKKKLKNKFLITHVVFRLDKEHRFVTHYGTIAKELDGFAETNIRNIREVIIKIRKSKLPDPKVLGNAGSFFKNPVVTRETLEYIQKFYPKVTFWEFKEDMVKLSAAWLIEECQWKSKKVGNAGTYRKQPLIIVNYGNASPEDILILSEKIQKAVKNHFAIHLEPEVNIV